VTTNVKVGKTMWLLMWVALLILMSFFFGDVLDEKLNPNRGLTPNLNEAGFQEVSLKRNQQGHYVANGKINGRGVTFLIDTGATDVALSENLANKLGLEKKGGSFSQTANGVVAVWKSTLDTVQLGGIQLKDVRVVVMPEMLGNDEVLLGMSFLKHLNFQQNNGVLTIGQTDRQ